MVDIRRAQRVAALATVRVETAPGDQLQIDFGQKRLLIAGVRIRIFLLVAVLFAKATGQLAKTDALDADGLALFAERVRPTPRPLPDATVCKRWMR